MSDRLAEIAHRLHEACCADHCPLPPSEPWLMWARAVEAGELTETQALEQLKW